jgi:hypothetical protein
MQFEPAKSEYRGAGDFDSRIFEVEPFPMGNLRPRGQPVSQQPKLINRNVAALNTLQQVRP